MPLEAPFLTGLKTKVGMKKILSLVGKLKPQLKI